MKLEENLCRYHGNTKTPAVLPVFSNIHKDDFQISLVK
jgi:hypothetical protein